MDTGIRQILENGIAIPAHPLALTSQRKLDERRQRGLSRYYIAAGTGGLAVGVHTTQFAIREPSVGLFKPVLVLAAEEMTRADRRTKHRWCESPVSAAKRSRRPVKRRWPAILDITPACSVSVRCAMQANRRCSIIAARFRG